MTAGFYIADIGSRMDAPLTSEGNASAVTAPLPVFGLRGQYHFSEKWSFRASAEFFLFEYEAWDGSLQDIYAGVDYQLFRHLAIAAGFNSVTTDLSVTKTDFSGSLDWAY